MKAMLINLSGEAVSEVAVNADIGAVLAGGVLYVFAKDRGLYWEFAETKVQMEKGFDATRGPWAARDAA